MIVYGGFQSNNSRYNDVWVYDTAKQSWWQPPESECEVSATGAYTLKRKWDKSPTPRGAHSANVIEGKMWIFGGYGGTGYGRRDFNDLFALDLSSWTWETIIFTGDAPESRSGHQSVVVKKNIYVSGGWNSMKQFGDLHIFDTEAKAWSNPGVQWDVPRWNHAACVVQAVPNWKIFVFGGNSGDLTESQFPVGEYCNDACVFDTGSNMWSGFKVEGEVPGPRSDSSMVFDRPSNRMLVFGGWANKWYDDVHVLSVGEVVGPPYSVDGLSLCGQGIARTYGPVTGHSDINVHLTITPADIGVDPSTNTIAASVRFACVKGAVDVTGELDLQTNRVKVATPNFTKYGPVEVEVRVAISGKPFTNTCPPNNTFKFHSVTFADQSMAFGPGLLTEGCPGAPTTFVIQSNDKNGAVRDTGGDKFQVTTSVCLASARALYFPNQPLLHHLHFLLATLPLSSLSLHRLNVTCFSS
jgi:dynein heavy chain